MLDPLSVDIPLASGRPEPLDAHLPVNRLLKPAPTKDDYIVELDYSTVSPFLECHRKFEDVAIFCREAAKDTSATSFGQLFHSLEETRLRAGNVSAETVLKQTTKITEHFLSHVPPAGDHRTADRMVQVIQQYNEIYGLDGLDKKIYVDSEGPFIERPFKIELTTIKLDQYIPYNKALLCNDIGDWKSKNGLYIRDLHFLYVGRIDVLLREAALLWVMDHKTSSRGGREFEEAFRLSLQTRGYVWAAQKITGLPVAGLIMNAAVIRPLTKTGVGTELNRHTYFYSSDSIEEWELDMKAHVSDIVACLVRGYFPQYSRSFKSPCAGCDYQENCALPRHQRAADLASDLYRDVKWDPMHDL